jgi:hypothetical protein
MGKARREALQIYNFLPVQKHNDSFGFIKEDKAWRGIQQILCVLATT